MIVIDVEMPENCDFCPCVHKQDGGIYDEDYCQITHYSIEEGQHGRPEWCPLYEMEDKPLCPAGLIFKAYNEQGKEEE